MTDTGTCLLCGAPVQRVPSDVTDEWWWAQTGEPTRPMGAHSHYAKSQPRPMTDEERRAVPQHCGWPLYWAPSGHWCRECDLPFPQLGHWYQDRAVRGMIWKLCKSTPHKKELLRRSHAEPALALLLALWRAADHDERRALHYDTPARTVLAHHGPLDSRAPNPWEQLRRTAVRGDWDTEHRAPTTLPLARKWARAHTTKDTTWHAVPVPTSDPTNTVKGWIPIRSNRKAPQ